jgi:hypothetical protein
VPQYPESPELDPPASRSFLQKAAGGAFALVGLLAAEFFLLLVFPPMAFALLMGALFGVVMWVIGAENGDLRKVLKTLMLSVAAAGCFLAGLVVSLLIALFFFGPSDEDH